ncbi:hypothetical protein JCM19233_1961 [Vibrio astriarenae]|nr:hypothetical protein JCM19233_1961 [Vibrio sp. C7]
MPKSKTALMGLLVVCITIICITWLMRDSLCEVHFTNDNTDFLATFVVYETTVK